MKFMDLLKRLEEFSCEYDLQEVSVSCNRIEGVQVLIFKHDWEVFDVMVIKDD